MSNPERPNDKYPSHYTPGVDFAVNPSDHCAAHVALAMAEESKRQGRRMMGQLATETEHDDLNIMFAGYPNGDCYVWFIEFTNFCLIAYIDGRWKTLGLVPIDHQEEFQSLVNEIANALNVKHHYPIEMPDDFKPKDHGAEDENLPDEENK